VDIRKTVGRNVRKLREAQDLSQEELSFNAGLHRTYVSGVERGVRNPTIVVVSRIAKALGVPPIRLFDDWFDGRPKCRRHPFGCTAECIPVV